MDYEKKYKEALLKARDARQNTESAVTIGILEEIFPELRESEDERIREAIITLLNTTIKGKRVYSIADTTRSEMVAWLEKQGEPTEINPSEFDLRLNKLLKQFETLPKEELISNLSYYLNVIQNDGAYKIEKQGEKESITIDADPVASYYDNVMISDTKNNKKQGEQKSTDKVEPKFKVGDWVVSKLDGKARQISEVHYDEYNSYYVVDGNSVNLEEYDRLHHLWTIQDAKDGDVLASDNGIIILVKESRDSSWGYRLSYHCAVLHDGTFEPREFHVNPEKFFPATKEQCDLLFKKMHEAGYEWDTEKKELKKIEQKSAWSEEDEAHINSIIDYLLDYKLLVYEEDMNVANGVQEEIDWLKNIKQRIG